MIQRSPKLLKEASIEASTFVEEQLRREGIEIYTETKIQQISHAKDAFSVVFEQAGETITLEAPHLLNALGRKPATDGLGLIRQASNSMLKGKSPATTCSKPVTLESTPVGMCRGLMKLSMSRSFKQRWLVDTRQAGLPNRSS